MKGVVIVTATIALLAGGTNARAQLPGVAVGARVRVDAPLFRVKHLDGTVVALTADTIAIQRDGAIARLPVAALGRLELFRGFDRRAGARRGAIWGGGVGVFMGFTVAGIASAHSRSCTTGPDARCEDTPYPKSEIALWTALTGGAGALYGAGFGALIGRQRWERLHPTRATLGPAPGGLGVRIAVGTR